MQFFLQLCGILYCSRVDIGRKTVLYWIGWLMKTGESRRLVARRFCYVATDCRRRG